jgi:hypothetical protein
MVVNYFTLIANCNNIIATQLVATNLQPNLNLIKPRHKLVFYLIIKNILITNIFSKKYIYIILIIYHCALLILTIVILFSNNIVASLYLL